MFSVANAAVYESDSQIREAPIIAKGRFHLRGQFARRFEHQTSKRTVLRQQRENWQSERRGLARAGLRSANQIFSGQNNWESAELDRRWLDKSHRLRAAHDFG